MKKLKPVVCAAVCCVLAIVSGSSGCGAGTSTGNPISGPVNIQSESYAAPFARIMDPIYGGISAVAVSDFRFCVTKLKLKNKNGDAVSGSDGSEEIEVRLGLIDISNSAASTYWGQVDIPVGYALGELRVEMHRDPELCSGADYSLVYNGVSITKDIEFRFNFSGDSLLEAGDTLRLGLSGIVAAIDQAYQQGKLNNEQIAEFLNESVAGTGEH